LHLRIALGDDDQEITLARRGFQGLDGPVAPYDEGRHHVRKDDGIPQRQER
jgi:hypothetical protein